MSEFVYWNIRRPFERVRSAFIWSLPRWMVMWCAVRLIAHATSGQYGIQIVTELTAMDALKRWDKP